MRAMWSGSISFGLVSIPVKAVPVQSPKDIRFELVHRECHGKLQIRRYCPQCDREVPEEEIVRAFRPSKHELVTVTNEELESLDQPARHTLQILDFVEMAEVDPVYFEKPYFLQPAAGGDRTYALLHQALTEAGRVGIGKVAFRDREHLALIRPLEHALVLETIAFPDEVRAVEEAVSPLSAQVDAKELKMAHYLIDSMSGHFEPEKYTDTYRQELEQLLQAKVEGGTVAAAPAPAGKAKGQVVDLMEVLRRSVDAQKAARGEGEAASAKKTPADKQPARAPGAKRTAQPPASAKPAARATAKPARRREKQAA